MKTISIHSSLAGIAAAAIAATALALPFDDAEARRNSGDGSRDHRALSSKLPGGLKATTTGSNKANPSPVAGVVIRDHRRPTCYAPGHCKPARFYFYQGQRYLLQPYGR